MTTDIVKIKHIIIVILVIIVFILIMIGKGNDRIDKDITKAVSREAGVSITDAVPEQIESVSNEVRNKQVSEKSMSAEAEIEEEVAQHISGKLMTAPGSIEEKNQHISGTLTLEKKSTEDQTQHISGK